ncbi:MAG: DNA cytosine methyltransferase [Shimia sp.]
MRDGAPPIAEEDTFEAFWSRWLRGGGVEVPPAAPLLRVVDLFGASGGFGQGAALAAAAFGRRAVFDLVADTDAGALDVYRRALPVGRAWTGSVSMLVDHSIDGSGRDATFDYPPEIMDADLAERLAGVDLLIAGPPCQGHSNLNNHTRRDDPRNDLFVTTVAVGVALGVPAMVIENVPSVTRSHGGVVDVARTLLGREGYGVAEGVLRMDALGGWQTRRRYFMLAVRGVGDDVVSATLAPWCGTPGRPAARGRPPLPAPWAIGDLVGAEGEGLFQTPPVMGEENRSRVAQLYARGLYDMPNDLRPDCHKDGTTYGSVYGRMHPDRPAPTITTGIGTPGQGRFLHPTEERLVTPHEAARLQGFPDGHGFANVGATRKSLAKWIGDAVPPLLGAAAIGAALEARFGRPFVPPWEDDPADGG